MHVASLRALHEHEVHVSARTSKKVALTYSFGVRASARAPLLTPERGKYEQY